MSDVQLSVDSHSSPTAVPTPDTFGIGSTQGQRSAEMVAALRAELMRNPETEALTSFRGRVMVNIMMRLVPARHFLHFIVARPTAFQDIIENNIPKEKLGAKIVEIAAGLSPRGLHLARALPNAQIIEVDLPGVVAEKQKRLHKAKINVPQNLTWRGADLGTTPLSSVLDNEKVEVVVAEGLSQYFPPKQIQEMARYIHETLVPGGVYICDISIEEFRILAEKQFKGAANFFSRQAGKFLGVIKDEATAKDLLLGAGYERVEYFRPSVVTKSNSAVPKPVIDLSAIFCAYKKAD